MQFSLPDDNDPRRLEVREWIQSHPSPSAGQLAESGYVVPHWPRPWGLDADPITQLVIDDELKRANIRRPFNPIGIGWLGPTIIKGGTQAQRERYLYPMLAGEELWCQLFSEPSAGSDLASLTTQAVPDKDVYIINGSKIWTTFAHVAKFGVLLARTNPDAPKHEGISYFICPMDAKGITIRTIRDMTGRESFNEVFFDDVRIPKENLVGEENRGWEIAKTTLSNERVSLSREGVMWGAGPTSYDLIELVRGVDGEKITDPLLRQRIASIYIKEEILRVLRLRMVGARVMGHTTGPEASIRKALADAHGRKLMELAMDIANATGMIHGGGPLAGLIGWEKGSGDTWGKHRTLAANDWISGFLFSPALTIGGGTAEVQRNVIAERILGLPRDVD